MPSSTSLTPTVRDSSDVIVLYFDSLPTLSVQASPDASLVVLGTARLQNYAGRMVSDTLPPIARSVSSLQTAIDAGIKSPFLRGSAAFQRLATDNDQSAPLLFCYGDIIRRGEIENSEDPNAASVLKYMKARYAAPTDQDMVLISFGKEKGDSKIAVPERGTVILDRWSGKPRLYRPVDGPDVVNPSVASLHL